MNADDKKRNSEYKDALKEAIREFLDEKFTQFGKWSAGAIVAVLLSGLVYMWAHSQGWTK